MPDTDAEVLARQHEWAWRIYMLTHDVLRVADRELRFVIVLSAAVAIFVLWSVHTLLTRHTAADVGIVAQLLSWPCLPRCLSLIC